MEKINFENASIVTPAKVTIDGTDYEVTPAQLSVVQNYLSAETLNQLQTNIEEACVSIGSTQPSTNENVWIKKGKNLFNKNNVLKNYEFSGTTGEELYNAEWYISDYIKVKPNTNYYLSGNKNNGGANFFYDANYNILSSVQAIVGLITTPNNAVYVRFNGLLSELNNNIQFEEGTEATTYEAFINKDIFIKNNSAYEPMYMGIESGSNLNGSWIKYSDGTMICKGSRTVSENLESVQITFPQSFALNTGGYQITVQNFYNYLKTVIYSLGNATVSGITVFPYDVATGDVPVATISFDYIAIGRWK